MNMIGFAVNFCNFKFVLFGNLWKKIECSNGVRYNSQYEATKKLGLHQANIQGVCKGQATECHHKKGRIGNDLLDETNWLALCHNCHEYVERERTWAMEKGFSIKRIN